MSEGRWRQIVSGYLNVSSGVYAPVTGPPDTLARMARVVGVTAGQLEEAGRADAAQELRKLEEVAPPTSNQADMRDRVDAIISNGELVAEILRRLAEQHQPPPRPDADAPDQGRSDIA